MEDRDMYGHDGFFGRLKSKLALKDRPVEDDLDGMGDIQGSPRFLPDSRYQIVVRRQIMSFQDAVAAADGLKRGEQQILNLSQADQALRDKIKDFMCGVNYAEEGTWEELGENIFLLAPPEAHVEVAPPSPRLAAQRN